MENEKRMSNNNFILQFLSTFGEFLLSYSSVTHLVDRKKQFKCNCRIHQILHYTHPSCALNETF